MTKIMSWASGWLSIPKEMQDPRQEKQGFRLHVDDQRCIREPKAGESTH